MDKKLRAVPRDLRESASAQRVAEDAALTCATASSRRRRRCGPSARRSGPTILLGGRCAAVLIPNEKGTSARPCPPDLMRDDDNYTRAHALRRRGLTKRRASGDYTRGKGLPANRGASALLPLAVPLDKYLLREASARDAGFLEVRDRARPRSRRARRL